MGKRTYIDLTGKRFGELEIICKEGTRGNNNLWKCQCHGCGNIVLKMTPQIRSYSRSCGCLRTRQGKESPLWQGIGDISRENWNKIYNNAKRRKIEIDVSIEYCWGIYEKQDRKCALTKRDIWFGRYRRGEITASLDRIDSSKPYIEGNVQWVHKHVNIAKHSLNQQYFIDLCKDIAKYN